MKPHLLRKILFIILFFSLFIGCLFVFGQGNQLADLGINSFSMVAYFVALVWMMDSYKKIKGPHRYFWMFFGLGICFLLFGKIVSTYERMHFGRMMHISTEDSLRLVGYLFFFIGFMYQIKVMKNTLPMLRFLLNIIIVITVAYALSWQYLVNPILQGNRDVTNIGFWISSITHAFNISLLFAAGCFIFLFKHVKKKTSFYLIAAGFLIQVVGDFFYITHYYVKEWIFIIWPISALFMGLAAVYSKEYPWNMKKEEKLEYNKISLLS
ncbi:hypothetical protein [Neobacillus sp. LXY-1]|uniref:hypothetical protein n=1 Tax=Neobacillus sp. LXY-1 TaxID=3379133 RepID=UPI003EE3189D